MTRVHELNIDGLVGPTHHYAGLAYGNKASMAHAEEASNPKEAALQGIKKMRLLHELGLKQAVLPPQRRPNLAFLNQLGFTGKLSEQLKHAYQTAPRALSAAFSASSMWAANSATVSPSIDTADQKVHFTAANLVTHLHRHQEARAAHDMLNKIFHHPDFFVHHPPLPHTSALNDEGAANHNRMAASHGAMGLHLFVYDQKIGEQTNTHFPARQTEAASRAIARLHQLSPKQTFFVAQHPKAIDAGVFHNDVISLANTSVFLVHQDAFLEQSKLLNALKQAADFNLSIIEIPRDSLTLEEAVQSYFFNAQLVSLPHKEHTEMAFIAPMECQTSPRVAVLIEQLISDSQNPISTVHYVALKQSMQNGGGPACLRLRVPLAEHELKAMHQGVLVTNELLDKLEALVTQSYRAHLTLKDFTDAGFVDEAFAVYDAIDDLLGLK